MTQPRFKIGDRVRCLNKSHKGRKVFEVCYKEQYGGTVGMLYYPAKIRKWHHAFLFSGCRESELELVK